MDEYVWFTQRLEQATDDLKEALLDGWEPVGYDGDFIILRKLVSRTDFDLLWIREEQRREERERLVHDQWSWDQEDDIAF